MQFKSKKQLDEENSFALLPNDDYELRIVKIEEATQDKYKAVPDKDGFIPQEPIIKISLDIVAYKDGAPVKDDEGKDATGSTIFFTGRPESMGFMQDGTPSKTRCLIAYATGQAVEDELTLESWEQLLDKNVFAEIIKYTTGKGAKRNKISRFITPRRQRGVEPPKPEKISQDDIPVIEDDEDKNKKNEVGRKVSKKNISDKK